MATDPNWRQNLAKAIEERRLGQHNKGPAKHPGAFNRIGHILNLTCDWDFVALMDAAAKVTGYNRSTFMRRAIAIQVAHVLKMPVHQVLWHSPAPGPYGGRQFYAGKRDHGEDIENWCPHPGCEGEHLRLR